MHLEALTDAGARLLPALSKFEGYYLAGGTALALQIGHRVSVDFDFFSGDDIPASMHTKVRRVFPSALFSPLVNDASELTVSIDGVKITFLKYPFPVIEPFVEYAGLKLLSVREIAATKAYTIGRRGALKDYVDLYFVLAKKHATLAEIIALAKKKFGAEFNSRLFLEQIIFLDDIEEVEVDFLLEPVRRIQLVAFFQECVRGISL
ncbi:MAG: nucleotidyl transferase AbiEii/AbiGii toxin family protein [Patescibacteria group bacterium]